MKKTYLKPEFLITDIELQNMIALSKVEEEANEEGEVLSRRRNRRNVWDEDEDEEEW